MDSKLTESVITQAANFVTIRTQATLTDAYVASRISRAALLSGVSAGLGCPVVSD